MIALREGALNVLLTLSYSKKKNNLMLKNPSLETREKHSNLTHCAPKELDQAI